MDVDQHIFPLVIIVPIQIYQVSLFISVYYVVVKRDSTVICAPYLFA